MSDKQQKPVSLEELTVSNMWQLEALINLLEQKGLLTKEKLQVLAFLIFCMDKEEWQETAGKYIQYYL